MTAWTQDEIDEIGAAEELRIASLRHDGTLSKPVTIWVIRHGDDLYVRSAYGSTSRWFRGTQERQEGHISAGAINKDVRFVAADDDIYDQIDTVYRTKYRRYSARYVDPIVSPEARAAMIRLVPK